MKNPRPHQTLKPPGELTCSFLTEALMLTPMKRNNLPFLAGLLRGPFASITVYLTKNSSHHSPCNPRHYLGCKCFIKQVCTVFSRSWVSARTYASLAGLPPGPEGPKRRPALRGQHRDSGSGVGGGMGQGDGQNRVRQKMARGVETGSGLWADSSLSSLGPGGPAWICAAEFIWATAAT